MIRGRTMFFGKGMGQEKEKGVVVCAHCGKRGHPWRCWALHTEQNPWKHANEGEEHCFHQTAFREGDASWWVKCVCSTTQTMAPSSGVVGYFAVKGASGGLGFLGCAELGIWNDESVSTRTAAFAKRFTQGRASGRFYTSMWRSCGCRHVQEWRITMWTI